MEVGVISFENGVNSLNSDYECFCHFNGMNPALLSLVIVLLVCHNVRKLSACVCARMHAIIFL